MKYLLIIEDDEDLLECLADLVDLSRWNVLKAENGEVGIELAKTHNIDLVLSDIDMPKMNGVEFLSEFRQINKKTPVIMMSGGLRFSEKELLKLGATLCIPKPIHDLSEIIDSVKAEN